MKRKVFRNIRLFYFILFIAFTTDSLLYTSQIIVTIQDVVYFDATGTTIMYSVLHTGHVDNTGLLENTLG